jgi:DNA-binding NarL/FixJ family response regulator
LVKRLKQQYGEAKWIIFYSAHPFTLDVYDIGANSFLAKNSDFYEIENKIIEGAKHLL